MRRETIAGGALIAGALMMLVTMGLHPVPSDFSDDTGAAALMAVISHAIGIASVPVTFFGFLGLSRSMSSASDLVTAALVAYATACIGAIIAAAASGLIGPGLIESAADADGVARQMLDLQLQYNHRVNQAFAVILVIASSAAILLWSVAMFAHRTFSRALAVLGIVVSATTLAMMLTGHLTLHVHGFGAVVLAQSAWVIATGVAMIRARPA